MSSYDIKTVEDLLVKYMNADLEFSKIYSCNHTDNVISIDIINRHNIENVFNIFKTSLYYFLRSVDLLNLMNVTYDNIEISRKDLYIKNTKNDEILIKININIF